MSSDYALRYMLNYQSSSYMYLVVGNLGDCTPFLL